MKAREGFLHPVFQGFDNLEGNVCPYSTKAISKVFEDETWEIHLREAREQDVKDALVFDLRDSFGHDLKAAFEYFHEFSVRDLSRTIYFRNRSLGDWYLVLMGDYERYFSGVGINGRFHPRFSPVPVAVMLNAENFAPISRSLLDRISEFEYKRWIAANFGEHIMEQVSIGFGVNMFTDRPEISVKENTSGLSSRELLSCIGVYNQYKGALWDYERFLASNRSFRVG